MNYYSMSDNAVLEELGNRIKLLRLRRNITQEALANTTLLSVGTIKSLEAGKGKLATVVAVLRELGALDELNNFIPEITISPLEIAKRKSPERVRAGRWQSSTAKTTESGW
ncbi:MAG: transcriptional regulator [Gammaproteobacteria bacterium]|nr:transcriptional regulator [Gammaproteobacteria bacterium]